MKSWVHEGERRARCDAPGYINSIFFKQDLTEKSMVIVILDSQSVNLQFSKTRN